MRDRSRTESLAGVADVGAKRRPGTEENGEGSSDGSSKDEGDDFGRRLGVLAEDVVDLGLGSVTERRLGNGEGNVGVAGDGQIEDLLLVGRGRAERSNDDRGGDRLRGSEELVGEVLLCLGTVRSGKCNWTWCLPARPCPCRSP